MMTRNDILNFLDIRKGRLHRSGYFMIALGLHGLTGLTEDILPHLNNIGALLSISIGILQFYVFAIIVARRLRDINLSGWFCVPIIMLYFGLGVVAAIHELNKENHFLDSTLMLNIILAVAIPWIAVTLSLLLIPPYKKGGKYAAHKEMTTRIIRTEIDGKKFTIENKWFNGLKLFQGNQLLAHHKGLFALNKKRPIITQKIIAGEAERLMEIFIYAPSLSTKIQVRIDGKRIAGDNF